jgi:glycosyltransferase 2 family protein
LASVAFLILTWSRSWRWGSILRPVQQVDQKILFPITSVGYMAIAILPFRLGELVRPVLINRKEPIVPFTSAISSIIVERTLDAVVLAIVLLSSVFILPLPHWLVISAIVILAIGLILIFIMILVTFNTDNTIRFIHPFIRIFPKRYFRIIIKLAKDFAIGFKAVASVKRLTFLAAQTLLVWLIVSSIVYLLFRSLNMNLPLAAIIAVLSLNNLGLMLPSAPGFVGNFEFSIILSLSFFDVSKSDALIFAIIFHVLGVGITILLGLIFLPLTNVSMKNFRSLNDQNVIP